MLPQAILKQFSFSASDSQLNKSYSELRVYSVLIIHLILLYISI